MITFSSNRWEHGHIEEWSNPSRCIVCSQVLQRWLPAPQDTCLLFNNREPWLGSSSKARDTSVLHLTPNSFASTWSHFISHFIIIQHIIVICAQQGNRWSMEEDQVYKLVKSLKLRWLINRNDGSFILKGVLKDGYTILHPPNCQHF